MKVTCDVFSASQERLLHLVKEETLTINDIDKTNALADMHLIPRGSNGYVLAVLGKNGEAYPDVVVDIELSHRFFTEKLKYTLITDENGCIYLGRLMDVKVMEASARSDLVYQSVPKIEIGQNNFSINFAIVFGSQKVCVHFLYGIILSQMMTRSTAGFCYMTKLTCQLS